MGVGAFRYSAALVPWTGAELGELEKLWVQAYKRAWLLPLSTASDVFTLPQEVGGLGYPRPLGIMAQELCRHLQRSIKHDDVAKQIAQWDLDQTLEKWACASLHDLQQEMALWTWDQAAGTKWARAAKCMQLLGMQVPARPVATRWVPSEFRMACGCRCKAHAKNAHAAVTSERLGIVVNFALFVL